MTVFRENDQEEDAKERYDGVNEKSIRKKLPEITEEIKERFIKDQMIEITEKIEAKRITVTPELLQLINDLARKINHSPSDEMAADHILIRGSSLQAIDDFLYATELTLQHIRHCNPTRHEYDSISGKSIKELRMHLDYTRFEYLLLEGLRYPFRAADDEDHLFKLMKHMRVVATMRSSSNQLPPDIKRRFRIQVDLDSKRIIDRNIPFEKPELLPIATQGVPVGSCQETNQDHENEQTVGMPTLSEQDNFTNTTEFDVDEYLFGNKEIAAKAGCCWNTVVTIAKRENIPIEDAKKIRPMFNNMMKKTNVRRIGKLVKNF